jgi:hypothetical protein
MVIYIHKVDRVPTLLFVDDEMLLAEYKNGF